MAREYARRATIRRRHAINQLLGFDYNGDYTVTRAEIIEYSRSLDATQREEEADSQMARFDRDGDGVATLEEVTQIDPEEEQKERDLFLNGLLALDPDDDGQLTVLELSRIAKKVFDHFDQNENGLIDKGEHHRLFQYQSEKRIRQRLISKGCVYPVASVDAELVLFSTYQAGVLANTWIGKPSVETSIADVIIEPGQAPLYIILDSYHSTIWRFSGATERVEKVVASSFDSHERKSGYSDQDWPLASAVAAIGIDEDRFHALPAECLTNGANISNEHRGGADRIAQIIGRSAMNVIANEYNVGSVKLPQATAQRVMLSKKPAPEGFDALMWRDAIRYKPGGLENVDPASLVTSQAVGVYKVLPHQFGLAQLLASGALERIKNSWLLITDAMPHWPARLTGSHREDFVVKDGVNIPEGYPGHSCVITEAQAAGRLPSQACRKRMIDRGNEQESSPKLAPIRQELYEESDNIIVTN
ncbi:MAG: hypothetical protein ABJP02_03385 [Parasphingorhabdus sp.]|uniref:hypothetical protein n=1 Tax=Parasphingorhabdus sp. TaxID=2709688 RepID=UPI003298552F